MESAVIHPADRIETALAALAATGVARLPGALSPDLVARIRGAADAAYARFDADAARHGPWQAAARSPAPAVPTASSLALSALGPVAPETVDAIEETLGPLIDAAIGAPRRRLDQQAWLRRQPAPSRAPTWHAPHAWHQDGGLGFDYLNDDPTGPDALLPMITAWVPLMPCGRTAPGLRYDPRRRDTLIPLDALDAEAAAARPTTPALSAGEAILMTGGLLHATAVDPTMADDRISIELRWLPARHPGRRGSEP